MIEGVRSPAAAFDAADPPRSAARVVPGLDRVVVAGILAVGAYSIAMAARGIEYLLAQSADDAAYYLRVAENAAHGLGFTFDGLAPTNGFHPLWAWVLTALHRLVPLSPEGMVTLVWVLQSVLMTVSAWILWRLLRRHTGSWPAALGTVLYVGRLYYTGRGGMESSLLLLLVLVLLDRADRWRPYGPGRAALVGVLAGLCVLARLDSVFVAGAIAAAWSFTGDRGRRRLVLAAIVAGAATLTVLPYLVSNLRGFGHLVPISGMLKSSFPDPGWYAASFRLQGQDRAVLLAALLCAVAFLASRLRPEREQAPVFVRTLLLALAAGVLAHLLYSALFMRWGIFGWHFVLVRLALALTLPVLMARFVAPGSARGRVLWPAVVTLVALVSALPIMRRDWREDVSDTWAARGYEAARWVQRETPEDAIFAMNDSGAFGYFSRRRVVSVDGLVNSFAYQDSLAAGRFEGFLRSRGVDYFVQHAIVGRPDVTSGRYDHWRFESWSRLHDRAGGGLTLRRADEVYRSRPYPHAGELCVFLVWRVVLR